MPPEEISSMTLDPTSQRDYANNLETDLDELRRRIDASKQSLYGGQLTPMSSDQLYSSAVLGLAPILAGYAFGGKEGAHSGSQASLFGLSELNKNFDSLDAEKDKSTALSLSNDLNRLNDLYDLQNKARYSEAAGQDDLIRQMALYQQKVDNPLGTSLTRDSQPITPFQINLAKSMLPTGVEAEPSTQGDFKAALDYSKFTKDQEKSEFDRIDKIGDDLIKNADLEKDLDDKQRRAITQKLAAEKLKRSGLAFPNVPDDKQVEEATDLRAAYQGINRLNNEVYKIYKRNGGVGYKFGDDAAKREILEALRVIGFKNLEKMGANFTLMESQLTKDALSSPASFYDFLTRELSGKDLDKSVRYAAEQNSIGYVNALAGYGAIDLNALNEYLLARRDRNMAETFDSMGLQIKDGKLYAPNKIDDMLKEIDENIARLPGERESVTRLKDMLNEQLGKVSGTRNVTSDSFQAPEPASTHKSGMVPRYVIVNGRKWDGLKKEWVQ